MENISLLLQNKKVLVCAGSGGVGKTTTSAMLAICGALLNKKVVVITIDPAKRLTTSLGIGSLGNEPQNLSLELKKIVPECTGELWAVMPENKYSFERFLKSVAKKNPAILEKLFQTSIYKIFAQEFSGTNEYLAMEKLYELVESKKFDLVILDTPPSANTLEFLEAPKKLMDFFDDKMVKFFINPSHKILTIGIKKVLEVLEKITGKGFIAELIDFTAGFFELKSNFMNKLTQIHNLLKSNDLAFLMITTSERLNEKDTLSFVEKLREQNFNFFGFILNRCLLKKFKITPDKLVPISALSSIFYEDFKNINKNENLNLKEEELNFLKANFETYIPKLENEWRAILFFNSLENTQSFFIEEQDSDVVSLEKLTKIAKDFLNS
jgi:anion-transporting  ArsA/GET3 family ATPase